MAWTRGACQRACKFSARSYVHPRRYRVIPPEGIRPWDIAGGKSVLVLWADNDDNGRAYVGRVAQTLLAIDCQVEIVDIEKLPLPARGDVVDWLGTHQNALLGDRWLFRYPNGVATELLFSPAATREQVSGLYPGSTMHVISDQSSNDFLQRTLSKHCKNCKKGRHSGTTTR